MPTAEVLLQLKSQVAPQIAQTADAYKALSAAERKAEQDAARYAQTLGKVALADARTAVEEQKLAVQTANVARAQDQAALAALRLANAQEKAASGNSFAAQTADAFKSQLLGIVGPAAIATAALAALKGAADLAQLGAQADLVRTRFDQMAAAANTSGGALLSVLQKASGGQISNLNLELSANRALLLGVADSAAEFTTLLAIARDRAQLFGLSTTDAFNRLVEGIGKAEPELLDELGIVVNGTEANKAYAASLGISTDQLTKKQRSQALANAVLAQGNKTLADAGGAADGAAAGQARLQASTDNVKAAFGSLLANGTAPFVNSLSDLINITDGSEEHIGSLANCLIDFTRQISGLPPLTADQTKAQQDWTRSVQDWIIAREVQLGLMDAQPSGGGGGGTFEFQKGVDFANAYTTAASAAGQAAQAAAAQIQFFGQAADISARSSVADAAAKDAQQAKTALVSAESNKAVAAFLQMNPQIDAAGVAALIAAGKLDPFIGRLIALQVESSKAKDELIKLNNAQAQQKLDQLITLRSSQGIGSGRGGGSDAAAEGQAFADSLVKQAAAAKKAVDDQIALAKAMGDTAKARRLLNQQLTEAKRTGDVGEQARVIDAIAALDKKGSAGRISTAQSTALQLADIARTSGDDRARIERENQEKLRDAQQDFDVRRARSQEDFERQRTKLLSQGKRRQAAELADEFARTERREQEDFDRQRARTLRNNREALGDQGSRVENRVEGINARTAARGGTPSGLPGAPAGTATTGALPPPPRASGQTVAQLVIQGQITMDGKAVGMGVWPTIEVLVDDELAITLQQIGVPNSGAQAVAGVG